MQIGLYLKKVLIYTIILLLFGSCTAKPEPEPELKEAYSLETLDSFFGPGRREVDGQYIYDSESEKKKFEESCALFPEYRLRRITDEDRPALQSVIYTVYNVMEGGKYYVFWYTEDETGPTLMILESYYIKQLADSEKMESLHIGSTEEEVKKIAPSTRFYVASSVWGFSITLADNGKVYKFEYDVNDKISDIEISKIDNLCYILREDYP